MVQEAFEEKIKNTMGNNIKGLIREVLEKGYLMSLATLDDAGIWVADVIYVFNEDMNLYWISDPEARHSKAILKNPKVAGTITVSGAGENNLGIQFEGVTQRIEGQRYDLACKHYAKRNKPAPSENEDILESDSWYVLKPQKIELICEKLFGFDKQKYEVGGD